MQDLKIHSLEVENIQRVRAVRIDTKGAPMVLIGGKNEQGKSSTLNAILMAICGGRTIPEEPVHGNEGEGRITLDLGDLKITRTIQPDRTHKVRIEKADGTRLIQRDLNELIGKNTLDPVEFDNLPQREQIKALADIAGVDLAAIEGRRRSLYEDRTAVRRQAEAARAEADAATFPEDAPTEEPSVSKAQARVETARTLRDELDGHRRGIERLDARANEIDERLAQLALEIEALDAESLRVKQSKADHQEALTRLEAEDDYDEALEELTQISDRVQAYRDRVAHGEKHARATQLETEVSQLTARIKQIDDETKAAIAAAEFPVEGLEIDGDTLRYQGHPFSEAASSVRLRVSVAMAAALNPKLRVIFIRDGSLLDEDSLQEVYAMALQLDCQVFVERVGRGDDGAFIIEDGTNWEGEQHAASQDSSS